MVMSYEGWQFRMEVIDRSEELCHAGGERAGTLCRLHGTFRRTMPTLRSLYSCGHLAMGLVAWCG
jgi:hypothetical protein